MSNGSTSTRGSSSCKTIVILGASYGGARAARMLSELLAKEKRTGRRIVVIDRNTWVSRIRLGPIGETD